MEIRIDQLRSLVAKLDNHGIKDCKLEIDINMQVMDTHGEEAGIGFYITYEKAGITFKGRVEL